MPGTKKGLFSKHLLFGNHPIRDCCYLHRNPVLPCHQHHQHHPGTFDSPGKTCWSETAYELVSGWLVCTVMRGKSWSRIGFLIFSLLTFCSRIILCAGCCPGHCRCLAASLRPDQISHMEKASLRTAGPEFENWKQPERIKKKKKSLALFKL